MDDTGAIAYLVGWLAGWFLLWRLRPLPPIDSTAARPAVAVVVPARDEADALPHLLPPLVASARDGDEIVVVDDGSTDGTADTARSLGARVVVPPELPPGWLGKPHACWHGASATTAPVLAFLDADVRPPADLLDRLGAAVGDHPGDVVSVQPWHEPGSPAEHLSALFNIAALMGVGRFSPIGSRVRPRAAFGPVLALDRSTYEHVGGHARPDVRTLHTEDIGLARAVGGAELFTGRPDVRFRMYPGGFRELVRGWTRSIATGASAAPWWAALLTLAWVWSLAGGWLASPWFWATSAVQVAVLARRAGRFSPIVALLYPVALAVFVVVFVRSLVARALRRDLEWKHRRVAAR
ncbi:MAG: glycosyltransferase family 2 protein [Ilumatobacteraceae bacterium]